MSEPLEYVTRKGTEKPIGYVVARNDGRTTVCWGVSDKRSYTETIPSDQIVPYEGKIYSPEEVQRRQALEAGGKIIEEENTNG